MTGISINKLICSYLKSDALLALLIDGNNIVSLYINPTKFPFISIMRNSVQPSYSKEGLLEDVVNVLIDIVSNDYEETINIAERVRDILEYRQFREDDITIDNITVSNISESYVEDTYVQSIDFSITIH